VDAVPSVLLATAAVAAVLAVIAGLVSAVGRAPAVAHKAWLLVLVKLVVPPVLVLPVVWPVATATDAGLQNPPPAPPAADPAPLIEADAEAAPGPTAAVEAVPEELPAAAPPAPGPPAPPAPFPWRTALAAGWLAGAAAYWALVAWRVARFSRALRHAAPAPADVTAAVRRTADRLGLRRVPAALFVEAAVSPMVWAGFGRPRLVLPRRLWDGLPPDQREAVLAHELAHLRRGDHWVRRLEVLAVGLYWWFPVAWLACRRLRDAEEACCDAWVVWALPGRAAAYAEALVETVAFVSRPGWEPLASGGAARAGALKRRLTMILSNTPAPASRRPVAAAVIAAGLLALPVRPGLAEEPKSPDDPNPAQKTEVAKTIAVFTSDGPAQGEGEGEKPLGIKVRVAGSPPAEVAALADEVELLEAQGVTKAAQVKAAEIVVRAAMRKLELYKGQARGGAIPQSELSAVETEAETAAAQLDVRKAEYKEHQVRVNQAKRRLEGARRVAVTATVEQHSRRASDLMPSGKTKTGEKERPLGDDARAANDRKKLQVEIARMMSEVERSQNVAASLAAQRAQLTKQLDELARQQEEARARVEKMVKTLHDLKARYPDAVDPTRP